MAAVRPSWILRALAIYSAAALLFTWPLVLHPFSLLASTEGPGDSYLNLWILGWDLQTIVHHPLWIISGHVFDANIFYPAAGTLTYSDHLVLQSIVLAPIYLLTGNLAFCYNLLFAGSLVLCALAMHAFAREITGQSLPAWIAGLAWGFAPYHFSHLIHLQLQALYFLPLAFLFLHRFATHGHRRDAHLLGLTLAAQALSSVYYGVIGGVAIILAAIVYVVVSGASRRAVLIRGLLLAAVVALVIVAPVALKYWVVQQREGFGRTLREASQGSAAAGAYAEVPPVNLIYGTTGLLGSHPAGDPVHKASEQNLFPGFVLCVLAAAGLGSIRRRETRPAAIALALVAIVGFVLSLGPDGTRRLYSALYNGLFGFHAIRAPARFSVLMLFGLSGLGALALEKGYGPFFTVRFEKGAVPLFLVLIALEYANAPIHYVPAPAIETAAGRWLQTTRDSAAVVYLPLELDPASNTTFMLQSLVHGRPIVNGYSGERPSVFPGVVDMMHGFPTAEAIRTLLDLNVKYVVAPGPLTIGELPLVERARFTDSVVYEMQESPALESSLTLPDTPPLPDPASIPFSAGEKMTYSVLWTSGPVRLPAGQIMLEVRPGKEGARYEFVASGTTAGWVSTFFEADDRFTSQVDERLRPRVFEQQLQEGRRQVTRRVRFDRGARVARVQQGTGPEIALPVPADALDPLSAFYYARASALTPGATLRIPVNDASRNSVVDFKVGGIETITYKNAPVETVRTTPAIVRAGSASPMRLTVWFSRDVSKMPLRAEITGLVGVGSVRLELESVGQ